MAHVTLSIPDEIYEQMKQHPEIRWSEIIRKTVAVYLQEMKETSTTKEIRDRLSEQTLRGLNAISSRKAKRYHEQLAREGWNRARSLTQIS